MRMELIDNTTCVFTRCLHCVTQAALSDRYVACLTTRVSVYPCTLLTGFVCVGWRQLLQACLTNRSIKHACDVRCGGLMYGRLHTASPGDVT